MTTDEAKVILQAYRQTDADAGDPLFAEALALVERDPALRGWFESEQALDQAVSDDLESMPPPPGLRDRIVSSMAAQRPESRTAHWSGLWSWAGIAATVALFCSATLALKPVRRETVANSALAQFAISDAQHPKTHNNHGEDAEALNAVLKRKSTRLSDPLPLNFASLRETGCRTLSVEGREVLEVCFKRNGAGLHYYIARRQDFPHLVAPVKPSISDTKEASIATWADSAMIHVVVTRPDHAALEKLL